MDLYQQAAEHAAANQGVISTGRDFLMIFMIVFLFVFICAIIAFVVGMVVKFREAKHLRSVESAKAEAVIETERLKAEAERIKAEAILMKSKAEVKAFDERSKDDVLRTALSVSLKGMSTEQLEGLVNSVRETSKSNGERALQEFNESLTLDDELMNDLISGVYNADGTINEDD